MSNEINIEELERLAKAATPGPWKACGTVEQIGGDYKDIIPTSVSCTAYCYGGSADRAEDKDLIFIAASNPFAVLSLINRVKKAEAERDALAAELAELEGHEPVQYETRTRPDWRGEWYPWERCSKEQADDYRKTPRLHDWHYEVRELYSRQVPAEPVNARLLEALKRAKDSLVAFKLVPEHANCWEPWDEENLTALNSAIAAAEAQRERPAA